MAKYKIEFPRWEEDIATQKRTLLHLPSTSRDVVPRVGDRLIAVSSLCPQEAKGALLELVEVVAVRLCESPLRDWTLLNLPSDDAGVDAYRARWDVTNPDVPWESNPTVWRVVFRYLDGTEALTALAT